MESDNTPALGLVVLVDELNSETAAYNAIQNFISIYEDDVESISLFGPEKTSITNSQVHLHRINRYDRSNPIQEIFFHVLLQIRLMYSIVKNRNKIDIIFFHLGGTILLGPVLISRIIGLKPIIIATGSIKKSYDEQHSSTLITEFVSLVIRVLELVTTQISSYMIFLSESMKEQFSLIDNDSTFVTNLNYINEDVFSNRSSTNDRKFDLVYVGRFEKIKGVQKFVESVSIIAKSNPDIQVGLVGDGTLKPEVEQFVDNNDLVNNVELFGWVQRDQVSNILNNSKYIVLPSESEGVPKTLLEAMACGTVPIATPVGGIPDVIESGETGLLLKSNSPDRMAEEIQKFIDQSNWEQLSSCASQDITSKHTLERRQVEYLDLLQQATEASVTEPDQDSL